MMMAAAATPVLSSNSPLFPLNPSKSTSVRALRRPCSVISTQRNQFDCLSYFHTNNPCPSLHLGAGSYRSFWFVPVERHKEISLWQYPFGLQQRAVTHTLTCRMPSWRPPRVKGREKGESTNSEGVALDEQTLRQDLERAIKEENYSLAAKIRDELHLLLDNSKASVLAANDRFYDAFRNGDFVAMRSIWAKGDNICCVHPGAGAISGYDLVMGSWEIVCGADHEFPIMIDLRDVEVYVKGDVGYVTCLEVVKTKGSSWGRQVASNVFERVDGRWLMCIHHASHVDL